MTDSPYHSFYPSSLMLLNDFYQLTMSYGYWKAGLAHKESVFHLFFRKAPFQGGFTIAVGLEAVINFIKNFKFDQADLDYLAGLRDGENQPYFDEKFLNYLAKLKFTGEVDALPEGTITFPYEPIIRIQGPLIECQMLESPLLNLINFPSLIATKAARISLAAQGDPVLEMGLRRAQGIDGALTASRAAYIGGCDSTSNLLAGKLFDIPVRGTHSHSWVMVFDDDLEAFQTYAKHLPNNCVFLVDTYNTLAGVKKAIEVGKWLKQQNKKMIGIRLDSGDLLDLSIKSRRLLDQAGFQDTVIIASNDLDEAIIADLKNQGAQINVWGVGTNLVTAKNQSALDGVYKLSAIRHPHQEWSYKLKLSEQMLKISNPGILQVKRFSLNHENIADVIYDVNLSLKKEGFFINPLDPTYPYPIEKAAESKDLLQPIFRKGECVYPSQTLKQIKDYTKQELSLFNKGIKRFIDPQLYLVGMEKRLYDVKMDLIQKIHQQSQ